jgi:hypothetical protein
VKNIVDRSAGMADGQAEQEDGDAAHRDVQRLWSGWNAALELRLARGADKPSSDLRGRTYLDDDPRIEIDVPAGRQ